MEELLKKIIEIGKAYKDISPELYKELIELHKMATIQKNDVEQIYKEAQAVSLAYVAHINTSAKFYQEVFGKAVELNSSVKIEGLAELFENGQ